jgi:sugar/nucleoside kinase (ribokinase family)
MGKNSHRNLVVGVGSALIDMLVHADDAFLESCGASKGGMELVDHSFIEKMLAGLDQPPRQVPGGSACNTIVGIANLGGQARFVGKLCHDDFGRFFESDLKSNGVAAVLFESSIPTGRVFNIITPDAQRSMFTYLGASAEIQPGEITPDCFDRAAIVHIEGYLVFNHDLVLSVVQAARQAGARISLDLASYTVVADNFDFLHTVVDEYVDILIANEDEAVAFTGLKEELQALEQLSAKTEIAVVNIGKRGSYITGSGRTLKVAPAGSGPVVDTTGAGDLWAAGFLYGLVNGFDLNKCGRLASLCGFEVCRVIGADIPEDGWHRIRKTI